MYICTRNMISKEQYTDILRKYLPPNCVDLVYDYMTQDNVVKLHITRERRSKLGDYRCPQIGRNYHEISVNGNLNSYFFLWVLLHEMAHLESWKLYGNKVSPHGHEWQREYAKLIVAYREHFPSEVQPLLLRYVKTIPLPQPILTKIENELHHYDRDYDAQEELRLNDLKIGDVFELCSRPSVQFKTIEKRRTRWRCLMLADGREYLVAGNALVKMIDR